MAYLTALNSQQSYSQISRGLELSKTNTYQHQDSLIVDNSLFFSKSDLNKELYGWEQLNNYKKNIQKLFSFI